MTTNASQPLHGIRYDPLAGWEVWSHCLQFPVRCGSPADAKRSTINALQQLARDDGARRPLAADILQEALDPAFHVGRRRREMSVSAVHGAAIYPKTQAAARLGRK